ncbi:N-acylethanolamine amidohydrolase [Histoplasma capsulatum H143]|uniref:N-acylethanolamine amidohydrolase n=1 Tax=Ajellomyces capsulatus (strain H143) TaxID=544712 RepID=C6HNY2_AJECH|nr:N-acylethanolamine amidohydrolase [Histoplasma capsulatum H143]
MAGASDASRRFHNYPIALEGPDIPLKYPTESNPLLRGRLLALGSALVSSSNAIQSYLWRNAGFSVLREIPSLADYAPRYDPTVIPIVDPITAQTSSLPAPIQRRDGQGYYTSADYHALYLSGELTPTAVVEALFPLIRRDITPPGEFSVGFLESRIDIIRAAAAASTERYKIRKPLGPMDGVPVAIKDEAHLEGYKRTLGSRFDFTGKINSTSWCVKKWEEAGAIVVGKTSMHELGLGMTNNNPCTGTPRNPHNKDYYTGGSSGGSGYVVGAGLVPIALGADGGGSIRIPSGFCGIYGIKTTHGRVSAHPTLRIASTTGVLGTMTSSLDDLALSYRLMASPDRDSMESSSFPDPLSTIPSSSALASRPKVIGIFPDWVNRADPAVLALFNKAIDHYRTKNYNVVDISIPLLAEGQKAHSLTILAEISSTIKPDQIRQLTPQNKILVSLGANQASAQDFLAAQRLRSLLMSHLAFLFQKHPGLIIVTPTTPMPGWKIAKGDADLVSGVSDENSSLRAMEYVYLANFTGCPALSRPMGLIDGPQVPVGLMGMGEWCSEEMLIEWARDGEGMSLDAGGDAVNAKTAAAAAAAGKGVVRVPDIEKGGKWVDVISVARGAGGQESASSAAHN